MFRVMIAALVLSACSHPHSEKEVEAAMQRYDSLLQTMNAAAIAQMFTADGKLGEVAQGRDSIRKFLASFHNVKVLSQASDTKSIELKGDSATQTGSYSQTDLVNDRDTVHLKGSYTTHWLYLKEEGWKIRYIITQPIE